MAEKKNNFRLVFLITVFVLLLLVVGVLLFDTLNGVRLVILGEITLLTLISFGVINVVSIYCIIYVMLDLNKKFTES